MLMLVVLNRNFDDRMPVRLCLLRIANKVHQDLPQPAGIRQNLASLIVSDNPEGDRHITTGVEVSDFRNQIDRFEQLALERARARIVSERVYQALERINLGPN